MNCDDPPGLAWTQQDLYIPQPTICSPADGFIFGSIRLLNVLSVLSTEKEGRLHLNK